MPLQHYIYIDSNDDQIYLLVDEKGAFHEYAFQKSISSIREPFDTKPKNPEEYIKLGKGRFSNT